MLLVVSAIALSPSQMNLYGLPIWIVSTALIAWGWVPYQYIRYLSQKPYALIFQEDDTLHYIRKGRVQIIIPLNTILSLNYMRRGDIEGIEICLSQQKSYFFPYFSNKSYKKLLSALPSSDS